MNIYLNQDEIKRLHNLPLEGSQATIRDIFIIGCVTGLRFSDYSRLSLNHIQGNLIKILTKKRSKAVVIPIHPYIKDILQRNAGTFPASLYTIRYFNMQLPKIAALAGIRDHVTVEVKQPNKAVTIETGFKYQFVTTHTARRSFATNAYLAGIPVRNIMLITGHATEESFFMYVSTGKEENARELLNHSFFQS